MGDTGTLEDRPGSEASLAGSTMPRAQTLPPRQRGRPGPGKLGNAFVRALLRSPAHRVLSGSLMLVRVRGRRTGRLREFPVMYARQGGSLWVVCGEAESKSWWRNLTDPAPIGIRLRGKDYRATGRAVLGRREPAVVSPGLAAWVRRFPKGATRLGVRLKSDGTPDQADLDEVTGRSVVVEARLDAPVERPSRAARGFALVGIVGPAFYILFVTLLGLFWGGYDPIRDTQSELGAVDSPYGDLMNIAGFMGMGFTILAFSVAYHLLIRDGLAKKLAVILLVVAGVGMVVVGFFPCDAGCVDVTRTGQLHGTFSAPAAIGLPVALMISALVFRSDGRFGEGWQVVSFWVGLLTLATGPIVGAGLVEGVNGLLQRAGMWAPLIWVMAVSIKLYSFAHSPRVVSPPISSGS